LDNLRAVRENALRIGQKELSLFRQADPALAAIEQAHADCFFQIFDLTGK